jgi:hypothetical protein
MTNGAPTYPKAPAEPDITFQKYNACISSRVGDKIFIIKLNSLASALYFKEKVFIVDDSISHKTGENIELVSYHFDH